MEFIESLEIDGVVYENSIVPRNYKMNPETEDLIYGDDLVEGMRVLIDGSEQRGDETNTEFHNASLPVRNRWCTVTRVRKAREGLVFFIGLYEGGHKECRETGAYAGWLVKKSSIPPATTYVEPSQGLLVCPPEDRSTGSVTGLRSIKYGY